MSTRLARHRDVLDVSEHARGLDFELDPFQVEAMEAIREGRSVVVAAPTGAGKTQVAEFAIRLATASGLRAAYTTPLKALSNQKYTDFGRLHGIDNVGLLTGDHSIRGDAPIVVMTTEVLRNIIYEAPERLDDLGVVILDEVHYLQDRYRGGVWEEILIHLPGEVALVALSATVSNVEDFVEWVATVRGDTEAVIDETRPVPLEHEYCLAHGDVVRMEPTLVPEAGELVLNPDIIKIEHRPRDRRGRRGGRSGLRIPRRSEIIDVLDARDLLPAIYFIFSRQGCDRAVEQLYSDGVRLTSKRERRLIRSAVEARVAELSTPDLDALGYRSWLRGLEAGLASHHAGQVPVFREAVEELFVRGLVKAVFATETLSLGINMPARTVVVEKITKFGGERHERLTPGQYTQLAGRAGRRGIDDVGYAVVVWSPYVDYDEVAELVSARTYELVSSFRPTYNMTANLVARFDHDRAHHIVNSSFAQFQIDQSVVRVEAEAERQRRAIESYDAKADASKERDAHKRWRARAGQSRKRLARLERRVERRSESLSRRLDDVCNYLEERGYVHEFALTGKGQALTRLYAEADLVMAEALWAGVFDGLDPAELAAVVSVATYEARREPERVRMPQVPIIHDRVRALVRVFEEIRLEEGDRGLETTREPDPGFCARAYAWARGEGLDAVLADETGGGDFVRNVKQLVDVLRQLAETSALVEMPGVARAARQAADALWRGVVSLTTIEISDQDAAESDSATA